MVSKFSKVITAGKKFGKSKAWDQNNPHFYALEHILIDIWAYEVHEISKIRMRLGFLSFFLMDLFFIPVSVVFGNWPKILLGLIIYIFLGSSLLLLGISFFTFLRRARSLSAHKEMAVPAFPALPVLPIR